MTLKDNMIAMLMAFVVAGALFYMTIAELSRRTEIDRAIGRMDTAAEKMERFMSTGPRFSMQYGMSLCEHIYNLEVLTNSKRVVDCDAIRHALTTANVVEK